jgi:1-acylglycerol-3-phosphate O-acyltransferase
LVSHWFTSYSYLGSPLALWLGSLRFGQSWEHLEYGGLIYRLTGLGEGRLSFRPRQRLLTRFRSLARHRDRLPQPGSVIASSFTSPIDCLYLAAIFDPIFTASYPNTRLVQHISLFQAMWRALAPPQTAPHAGAKLVSLSAILQKYPDSVIVVLPECTTSNGRGILSLAPSILTAPSRTKIYPVNLRYSPSDVTTPLPGAYISFLWDLCSRPTHCIRVRIAEAVQSSSTGLLPSGATETYGNLRRVNDNALLNPSFSSDETLTEEGKEGLSIEERKLLDRVADDLARLGRAKRVGLGVREKVKFIKVWTKTRTIW